LPDVCFLDQHPQQDLILQLYDIGCIIFGNFVQASGATFPYYVDLRKIISNPQVFNQVIIAYEEILLNLNFDRIAGIPYGSLPTATGLSLRLQCPMIFPRKEVKAHGTRRVIEGDFHPGETVAVVDDILISGKSVMEGAEKLKSAGLNVMQF
jgi:uridine monophosphate synthetase